MMAQSAQCESFCGPLTPNGCDCFGCCELPAGSDHWVWLGSVGEEWNSVCTLEDGTDPSICHPCTPVPGCLNPCEDCELCIGKAELEPGCGEQVCPPGRAPCGLACQAPCGEDEYCVSGCCVSATQ